MLAVRLADHVAFSHATAAQLLGIPVPIARKLDRRIHVSVAAPARAPHATGLVGHQLARLQTQTIAGLRVTIAAQTWRDLGATLSVPDLVAAGDHIIHRRSPLAGRADLAAQVDAAMGTRGARRLREALALLDDRAESPQESILRCLLVLGGLPVPEVNYVVVDSETGKETRLDLRYPRERLVLEYEGDYHRSRQQWRRDMTRRSRLEAQGWRVMELNADDLRDAPELVDRVAAALASQRRLAQFGL